MHPKEAILSLNHLISDLIAIIHPPQGQISTPAQQQELAILSMRTTIENLTEKLLTTQHFKIPPQWNITELTAHVLEEDNVQNLDF
jgi:hypothetical protein